MQTSHSLAPNILSLLTTSSPGALSEPSSRESLKGLCDMISQKRAPGLSRLLLFYWLNPSEAKYNSRWLGGALEEGCSAEHLTTEGRKKPRNR